MSRSDLECLRCGRVYEEDIFDGCPRCRLEGHPVNLTVRVSGEDSSTTGGPGIWKYAARLPRLDPACRVSLGEGNTPLLAEPGLSEELGISLLIKNEAQNPTWSHKDRLAAAVVSHAVARGARGVVVSSTGNHGAAVAAYAARAGVDCLVLTVQGVPPSMVYPMWAFGGNPVALPTFEDRSRIMSILVKECGWFPASNYAEPPVGSNPYGIEGYKTIAYELAEELPDIPSVVVVPTANADALFGIWKGFSDLVRWGLADRAPRMMAAEVIGPLHHALEHGLDRVRTLPYRDTCALSIASETGTYQGLKALTESRGFSVVVGDDEIWRARRLLARKVGVLAETASAAAAAAVLSASAEGRLRAGDGTVVIINTACGLKSFELDREFAIVDSGGDFAAFKDTVNGHYGIDPGAGP